jgi:hypothetical protein
MVREKHGMHDQLPGGLLCHFFDEMPEFGRSIFHRQSDGVSEPSVCVEEGLERGL